MHVFLNVCYRESHKTELITNRMVIKEKRKLKTKNYIERIIRQSFLSVMLNFVFSDMADVALFAQFAQFIGAIALITFNDQCQTVLSATIYHMWCLVAFYWCARKQLSLTGSWNETWENYGGRWSKKMPFSQKIKSRLWLNQFLTSKFSQNIFSLTRYSTISNEEEQIYQ